MAIGTQLAVKIDHIGARGDGIFEGEPAIFGVVSRGAAVGNFLERWHGDNFRLLGIRLLAARANFSLVFGRQTQLTTKFTKGSDDPIYELRAIRAPIHERLLGLHKFSENSPRRRGERRVKFLD
jgi:hypothetical protein